MITVTDLARKKILEMLAAEERKGVALRWSIEGRGPGGFQYRLGFVGGDEQEPGDTVVDGGGFKVYVDAKTAPDLAGATLDYLEDAQESGFKIENPNPLWRDAEAAAVQQVLDAEINPAVAAHGGHVTLLDVREHIAYIALGGGCQGCGMVDVTLKQGIEVRIRETVPAIREIIDTTDHAGGRNPYYQSAKGGHSPLA